MTPRSNLAAPRATLKALEQAERLTEADAGKVELALCSAEILDRVVADGQRYYIADRLIRAHLNVLKELEQTPPPEPPDGFDQLLAAISTPGPGGNDTKPDRL